MTIALPIWNSREIVWLPMEGLCRQQTTRDWELIVMECASPKETGAEFFEGYWERLKKAGCKRMLYIYTGDRLPLGQKWKEIAKRAKGKWFLLQASDDYPHARRLEVTNLNGYNWYHTRFFHSYSCATGGLILFDKLTSNYWKTGNDMAMYTDAVRKLPDNKMNKGVDFYLFGNIATKPLLDEAVYAGVNTNGQNAISLTREWHFKKPKPPYKKTYRTIDELGVPKDIIERLKGVKEMTNEPVKAKLNGKFMHYCKGDIRRFNFRTFGTLQIEGLASLENKEYYEKELS